MRLYKHLTPNLVLIDPAVKDRDELLQLFASVFHHADLVEDAPDLVRRLIEREEILTTAIGCGVAIPHAQIAGLGRLLMAASIHPNGISYPALDDLPVRLVFCLVGDANTSALHLAGLARLARLARKGRDLEGLVQADSGGSFISTLLSIEGE